MSNRISALLVSLIAVMAFAFSTHPADAGIVTNGLVAYWTFDQADVDGDTVKDVVGGNNGTINGGAQIAVGKVGDGIKLNGVDQFVEVPHHDSLVPLGGFSVEAWFETELKDAAVWQSVVSKNSPGNQSYEMRISAAPLPYVLSWAVVDKDKTFIRINAPEDEELEKGRWYHVVGTWDTKEAHLYVDGRHRGSVEVLSILPSTVSVFIGQRLQDGGKNFFNGTIDEVRIYSHPLTLAEIAQNLKEGLAVEPAEKLTSTWGEIKDN